MTVGGLTNEQRSQWTEHGYVLVRGFAAASTCEAMQSAILDIVRRDDAGEDIGPTYVQPESRLAADAERPEDCVSKVFRVHREVAVFREFARDPELLALVASLLGDDLDCFLSQFIFKLSGALGQPWHQDSFYFPFDRSPQVGVWLAVTDATPDNGPLWVLPGSHDEPVHKVVSDRREHANYGYVEIVDHDTSGAEQVLMKTGDLLLFHSHLFHKSTDNESDGMRAAMVYHYAEAGTVDQSQERWGMTPPNIDWMPIWRGGAAV